MLIVLCESFCKRQRDFSLNLQLQVFLEVFSYWSTANCGATSIENFMKKRILLVSHTAVLVGFGMMLECAF